MFLGYWDTLGDEAASSFPEFWKSGLRKKRFSPSPKTFARLSGRRPALFAPLVSSVAYRSVVFALFLAALSLLFGPPPVFAAASTVKILEVALVDAISPAQADMLDVALTKARSSGAQALLVRLDTPGGGIEPMRRMVSSILNAPLPVILWVAPEGARVASAGVFLMAAAQVNAMAPQTTIGSASPVGPNGSELGGTLNAKVKNDLQSLLRSLATARGRFVDFYVQSVSKAANLTSAEAARLGVVDYIAVSREDLLTQIGRRGLPMAGQRLHFDVGDVSFETFEPGVWYDLLSWLLDPQIAYILLLAGMAGLFFELLTPGAVFPGVVGGLSLLLGLYALSILPTNATGLLLLALGAVFFLLEVHVTSYGLLSVAGVIALCLGSLLLFRYEGHSGLPLSLIAPTVAGVSLILGLAVMITAKAQRLPPRTGQAALVGLPAVIRHWQGRSGKVFVHGELWNAVSRQPAAFLAGQEVVIEAVEDMRLVVSEKSGPAS